jgi:hypothetical protein
MPLATRRVEHARQKAKRMGTYIGRKMNPHVSEWLMGFPQGWTLVSGKSASELWEMPLFRKSRSSLRHASKRESKRSGAK